MERSTSEREPRPTLDWKSGYDAGSKDTAKAYGDCNLCYGKGYSTTLEWIEGAEDFGGDGTPRTQLPIVRPCRCERGKQIEQIIAGYEKLRERMTAANGLLRSAHSIACRGGKETNWTGFTERIKEELQREHEIMYPAQYGDTGLR